MGELINTDHYNDHWHNNNTEYPDHTRKGKGLLPYLWCEDNGVLIKPQYHWKNGVSEWRIQIEIGNKTHVDPSIYQKKDIMEKIYKYAEYYYNKYKV